MRFIDKKFWRTALTKPDWYMHLMDDFRRLEKLAEEARKQKSPEEIKAIKREAYALVEEALENDQMNLAKTGEDFDEERRPIDTIVIHHTKNPPGMTLERLNAMHLLRLYGAVYAKKEVLQGQPVWSNHFRNDKQVFYGYHWMIRQDGQIERLLEDKHIGWHAGCWHVNTRSIGIVLDADLSDSEPDSRALAATSELIKHKYPQIKPNLIIGHCEVLSIQGHCPGKLFLSDWKPKLLDLVATG